ncbi:MAG: N-acetylmuramoyl-L-alanine amidase [Bacteroidetes bacterium]|nr:MAG: N-acetylmuramoyl-L-alanine amidase [Bacteroidota bacterium]
MFNPFKLVFILIILLVNIGYAQEVPFQKQPVNILLDLPVNFNGEVSIEPLNGEIEVNMEGKVKFQLPELPKNILITAGDKQLEVKTKDWNPPYSYKVLPDGQTVREGPWVEFRRLPEQLTYDSVFNVLCKSEYPGQSSINGKQVKMYQTGIFFKKVIFKPGWNTIKARVADEDGNIADAETSIFYQQGGKPVRAALPLWIDSASFKPAENQVLLSEDHINLSFKGSKGQSAYALIRPGKIKVPLQRKDFRDYSLYQGNFRLNNLKKNKKYFIEYVLESTGGRPLKYRSPSIIGINDLQDFPLVETNSKHSLLTYNLGPIRLGGPIIADYPKGVHLQVNGDVGDYYRIALDKNTGGMIKKENVQLLPPITLKPTYFLQYATAVPGDNMDMVNIPYSQPVPYAVFPEPDQGRIRVILYGVKTSSTWLSHRQGLKIVDKLTWQQTTPDTYEMIVQLKTSKLWGYELVKNGNFLQLQIKHPPHFENDHNGVPAKGLKVAIEAGHGGHNTGTTGLSGMLEKDVNLDVALKLEKICNDHGIEVVMVREEDTYMTLQEKRDIVETSDAHLLVSIHANAAATRGDYLRVGGVSTYYHNPFWAGFAEIMYGELLELPLDEFGAVGSFNYLVTRMSSRPAVLVEQGFMSHAEDEEKLASPEFRQQMAEKIFRGIIEFVRYME